MKKKVLYLVLYLLFALCLPVFADTGIKVVVDNIELTFDVPPVNQNGRLLVPVRAIFEALGAEVDWDKETQTVTAVKGETEVKLIVGGAAVKNGIPVTIDVPASNISGRVLVPLRFVSEALGAEVSWSDANQCAYISDINAVAMKIHEDAWLEVASKAAYNPNYKYALYASRSLTVKNPEYYLKGDDLFDKYFRTLSERYYLERTQNTQEQDRIFEDIEKNSGNKFNWETSFDIKNHRKVGYNIYHTEAFLPYIDMRMHFMGSALKGTDWQATSISKAEFLYFKYHDKKPYLLFTEDGTAYTYLSSDGKLLNDDGSTAEKVVGKLALVFNEEKVWYPLMDRDDRGSDTTLAGIVGKYSTGDGLPELTETEKSIVQYLKQNTGLSGDLDQTWALFFAGKLHMEDWRWHYSIYSKLCPDYASVTNTNRAPMLLLARDSFVGHISNLVCPATSYLASIAKLQVLLESQNDNSGDQIAMVGMAITREYFKYVDTELYGKGTSLLITSEPENYYFNMDDTYLAKVGMCLYGSIEDMSILTVADLKDVEYFSAAIEWATMSSAHVITPVYYKNSKGSFENLRWGNGDYLATNRYKPTLTSVINNKGWILIAEASYFNKPQNQILTNMSEAEAINTLKRIAELSPDAFVTTKINPPNPSEGIPITEFIENIQDYRIIRYDW